MYNKCNYRLRKIKGHKEIYIKALIILLKSMLIIQIITKNNLTINIILVFICQFKQIWSLMIILMILIIFKSRMEIRDKFLHLHCLKLNKIAIRLALKKS